MIGTLGAEVARSQGEALLAVTRGIVAGASRVSRGKGALLWAPGHLAQQASRGEVEQVAQAIAWGRLPLPHAPAQWCTPGAWGHSPPAAPPRTLPRASTPPGPAVVLWSRCATPCTQTSRSCAGWRRYPAVPAQLAPSCEPCSRSSLLKVIPCQPINCSVARQTALHEHGHSRGSYGYGMLLVKVVLKRTSLRPSRARGLHRLGVKDGATGVHRVRRTV